MSANSERNPDFVTRFANWDNFLAALTIAVVAYALLGVPNFASVFNISQAVAGISERALIVLPMVLLIIAREIDLSVGSILALTSVIFGLLIQQGAPLLLAIPVTLVAGGICGGFNGLLVTKLGLPSLVVTLGTMALFRGIAYILLGSDSINDFPDSFLDFGIDTVGTSPVPQTILPFLLLAPVFAIALQKMPLGRRIYAIGGSPDAARYSGIRPPERCLACSSPQVRCVRRLVWSMRRGWQMPAPTMQSASNSTSSPSRFWAGSASSAGVAG